VGRSPDVLDAAVFGSSIHAVVSNAQAALPKLAEALSARGLRVGRIEPIPPTLEDVFVGLTAARHE